MFNMKDYLANKDDGNAEMLVASNYAGKAINITQTTAAHAMSYKLTSLYGIPHGRAVFMCLPSIWKLMEERIKWFLNPNGMVSKETTGPKEKLL